MTRGLDLSRGGGDCTAYICTVNVTCVVLAAGRATRMGGEKLLLPLGAGTVLDAVIDACTQFPIVLVTTQQIAQRYASAPLQCVVNDEPQRGMAHSLRLANRSISAERTLAVLLGDKPLVSSGLVARIVAAQSPDADVIFPVRDGVPGHPVVLSPRARALVDDLRDGDTLHLLRDDRRLRRRPIEIEDEGAYLDIDTEADYRRLAIATGAGRGSVASR